jgi:hypothetical protein
VIVGDLAASLGVGWRPAPAVSVEVGYRVEDLINVRDSFNFANTGAFYAAIDRIPPGSHLSQGTLHGLFNNQRDVLMQGPYVKAVVKFDTK